MAHNLRVPAHFGIRGERYKLIFFYGCTPNGKKQSPVAWEFYDLEKDPQEMHNQYANPEYAKIIADMKFELKRIRADLNETDEKYPSIQGVIDSHWR